jgi:hypothetical protein
VDSPSNYPDGLTQAVIDALVAEIDATVQPVRRVPPLFAYAEVATASEPTSALLGGGSAEWRQRRTERRASFLRRADVHDTRAGGPNRQERARRVGAPQSPATATKESGMLQLSTCVSVRCDQCGQCPSYGAPYSTEDAALDAAASEGWRVGTGGQLWCSACATVLICEAEGHEFSAWRHPVTSDGHPALSEYRHCRRCCLVDSRPASVLLVAEVA